MRYEQYILKTIPFYFFLRKFYQIFVGLLIVKTKQSTFPIPFMVQVDKSRSLRGKTTASTGIVGLYFAINLYIYRYKIFKAQEESKSLY